MSEIMKEFPTDWNETINGRFLARMVKNKAGMYRDEKYKFSDGRITLCRFPYTKRRAAKHNFREMTLSEIEAYDRTIRGAEAKPSYAVLERKLKEHEERERLREEAVAKKKREIEAKQKAMEAKAIAKPIPAKK